MEDISLHILDIAENAIRAEATTIEIEILEDEAKDLLSVCIKDDGSGMDEEMVKNVANPFFTTKDGKRTGLGLPLLSLAAQQTGGNLDIESQQGFGTTITAIFKLSHPDMKPMGNIAETLTTLIIGNPSIRLIFDYKVGGDDFHFDSNEQNKG